MDKLKALLEHFGLEKYLGDLMTMGVFPLRTSASYTTRM